MSYNQNLSISKSVPKESHQKNPQSSSSSTKPSHQDNNNNNNQQQTLKCPRCNSPNTKFCYYNNYSLSQPRHFCKTCRRYWTRGGALRNVPVGGGCRKTKKSLKTCTNSDYPISTAMTTPCSSSSSRFFSVTEDPKFFNGLLVSNTPAIDFQLSSGFLNQADNLRLESSSSFGEPNCGSNLSLMGFNNFSLSNSVSAGTGNNISSMGFNGNIASSIETLSSLNQDLHLKLQQQRMAMIFGNQNQKETMDGSDQCVKPQPILFQNLETDSARKEGSIDAVAASTASAAAAGGTEWLFGNIPTVQAWFQQ